MKIKVIMNSGKEYTIDTEYSINDFVSSFYNETKIPMGGVSHIMKNSFMYLDEVNKIMFNPTHVSSIEVVE